MKITYKIGETNNKSTSPPDTIELDPMSFNPESEVDKVNVFGKYAFLFSVTKIRKDMITVVSTRDSGFFWTYNKIKK